MLTYVHGCRGLYGYFAQFSPEEAHCTRHGLGAAPNTCVPPHRISVGPLTQPRTGRRRIKWAVPSSRTSSRVLLSRPTFAMKEDSGATCPPTSLELVDPPTCPRDAPLKTMQLGVWTVTLGEEKAKVRSKWTLPSYDALHSHSALVRRLFFEVWRVDPWAVAFLVLHHLFVALEYSFILYFSGRLLNQVSSYCSDEGRCSCSCILDRERAC